MLSKPAFDIIAFELVIECFSGNAEDFCGDGLVSTAGPERHANNVLLDFVKRHAGFNYQLLKTSFASTDL